MFNSSRWIVFVGKPASGWLLDTGRNFRQCPFVGVRLNWALPCMMISVTHWRAKQCDYEKRGKVKRILFKPVLRVSIVFAAVCAYLQIIRKWTVTLRGWTTHFVVLSGRSVEDSPPDPSRLSHDLRALIRKEAKRLNSANQQVNNLFLQPWPQFCSWGMNRGARSWQFPFPKTLESFRFMTALESHCMLNDLGLFKNHEQDERRKKWVKNEK